MFIKFVLCVESFIADFASEKLGVFAFVFRHCETAREEELADRTTMKRMGATLLTTTPTT